MARIGTAPTSSGFATPADEQFLRRAAAVVRARRPEQVPAATPEEARLVGQTSDWFHGSKGVRGLAIGPAFSGGTWTDEVGLQVFVGRRRQLKRSSPRRVRPFSLAGRTVATSVIEWAGFRRELGVGDLVGDGQNCGTVAGFLAGPGGELYLLSAAHVLCETYDDDTPAGRRDVLSKGDPLFAYDASGVKIPDLRIAELFDRRILDFANVYTLENVDAAIALVLDGQGATVQAAAVPYASVGHAALGDAVRVLGGASGTGAAAGTVRSIDYAPRNDQYCYADPSGVPRPVWMEQLYMADYASAGGDSGGMVVRGADRAAVGLHIGRDHTGAGSLGVFLDVTRAVSAWPSLTLLTGSP